MISIVIPTLNEEKVIGILSLNLLVLNNVFHRGESVDEFQMMRKEIF